jgi:hypothetical protein
VSDFDRILNWKLMVGSHEFPGPDGGTCINEAAIVAAGFPYQPVTTADDMPPCFSRVISEYVLTLNDDMPDGDRQRLVPYVLRLAGTADSPCVERARAEHLAMYAVNVLAAREISAEGMEYHAAACRAARTPLESTRAIGNVLRCLGTSPRVQFSPLQSLAMSLVLVSAEHAADLILRGDLVSSAERSAQTASYARVCDWDGALSALDGALAIGRQADPLPVPTAADRLDEARRMAPRKESRSKQLALA